MDHWRDIFWTSRSGDFFVLLEFVPGAAASHALFGFRRRAWHTGFLLHREPMGWSARFELDGVLGFASSTLASVAVASSASAPSPWWSTSFFSRTASIVLRPLLTHFINIQAISLFGQSVWGAGTLRTCWSDAACSPCAMYRRGFCNAGMRTLGSPCSCGRWLLGSGTCTRLSKEGLQVLRGESIAQAWC